MRVLVALAALACLIAPACAQSAEKYPEKPIKIVVPFPPGGSVDVLNAEMKRIVALPGMGDRLAAIELCIHRRRSSTASSAPKPSAGVL